MIITCHEVPLKGTDKDATIGALRQARPEATRGNQGMIALARVVQRPDNAIHRINHYPADSVVCYVNTYPLDSDLSGG